MFMVDNAGRQIPGAKRKQHPVEVMRSSLHERSLCGSQPAGEISLAGKLPQPQGRWANVWRLTLTLTTISAIDPV